MFTQTGLCNLWLDLKSRQFHFGDLAGVITCEPGLQLMFVESKAYNTVRYFQRRAHVEHTCPIEWGDWLEVSDVDYPKGHCGTTTGMVGLAIGAIGAMGAMGKAGLSARAKGT